MAVKYNRSLVSCNKVEMHYYIVQYDRTPSEELFESILKFSHLLFRELLKGSSPCLAIFINFSVQMRYYNVHSDSKPWRELSKSTLKFSHLLI